LNTFFSSFFTILDIAEEQRLVRKRGSKVEYIDEREGRWKEIKTNSAITEVGRKAAAVNYTHSHNMKMMPEQRHTFSLLLSTWMMVKEKIYIYQGEREIS